MVMQLSSQNLARKPLAGGYPAALVRSVQLGWAWGRSEDETPGTLWGDIRTIGLTQMIDTREQL
jgi:hypothetical protein